MTLTSQQRQTTSQAPPHQTTPNPIQATPTHHCNGGTHMFIDSTPGGEAPIGGNGRSSVSAPRPNIPLIHTPQSIEPSNMAPPTHHGVQRVLNNAGEPVVLPQQHILHFFDSSPTPQPMASYPAQQGPLLPYQAPQQQPMSSRLPLQQAAPVPTSVSVGRDMVSVGGDMVSGGVGKVS